MGGEFNPYKLKLNLNSVCQVLACHEAGHGVVSYALGRGCSEIVIETELDPCAYIRTHMTAWNRIHHCHSLDRFTSDLLAIGIIAAAGTAATRRLFVEIGRSPSDIGSPDDRAVIDAAANSIVREPRSRFAANAYRRLVWRLAQRAAADERIWNAVLNVTGELTNDWLPEPLETRATTRKIYGAKIRAIAKRAGVAPGMFGERVHEMSAEFESRRWRRARQAL